MASRDPGHTVMTHDVIRSKTKWRHLLTVEITLVVALGYLALSLVDFVLAVHDPAFKGLEIDITLDVTVNKLDRGMV